MRLDGDGLSPLEPAMFWRIWMSFITTYSKPTPAQAAGLSELFALVTSPPMQIAVLREMSVRPGDEETAYRDWVLRRAETWA
jgi:hypothetical protein